MFAKKTVIANEVGGGGRNHPRTQRGFPPLTVVRHKVECLSSQKDYLIIIMD
jgi:hypothetical protein